MPKTTRKGLVLYAPERRKLDDALTVLAGITIRESHRTKRHAVDQTIMAIRAVTDEHYPAAEMRDPEVLPDDAEVVGS